MRALFAHNIRVKKDNEGSLYTHSSYNANVWRRYQAISKNINIISTKDEHIYKTKEAQKKFEKFDHNVMDIVYIKDIYKSLITYLNPYNHIYNGNIIKKSVIEHDYVIARLPSYAGFKAIKYAKKNNLPYMCEVVACPWDGLWNHSFKGKVMAPFSYFNLKRVVKKAPYVVYVTNRFLQKRYPTDGKSTNCSNVTLTEFDNRVLERRINKIKSASSSDRIIIGTTAAVNVRFKGQQYVIEALGKLKKEGYTNFEYQLVGGGNQSFLKKIAKKHDVIDQVKFLGSLPHSEVFNWLEEIDIYAQPSRQEGLPRAVIEAMSKAVPTIGAKTAGIPELLDSKFIFSNTRKNIDEICSLLKMIKKTEMIEQAKRNFQEAKKYDKKVIDERRKKFFEEFKDAYQLR